MSEQRNDDRGASKTLTAGTHRTCPPAETVARMRPFFATAGITRVANVTGLDVVGIPTVMVVRPNGRSLSVCQGKGPNLEAARASGVMEAIEHHLAEQVRGPLVFESATELARNRRVVDVDRLPHYVRPFMAHERILWMRAESVPSGESIFVPYEIVHLDFTLPLPPKHGFFPPGSNGLASGNNRNEALIHGICELIERDALSLFYREPAALQQARRVDPASIDDAISADLLARYERAGVRVGVWDVTSEVGVPCYLCIAVDEVHDAFRPTGAVRGSGCHPDRAVALIRALCEAAQSRLTRIAATRDDIEPQRFTAARSGSAVAAASAQLDHPGAFVRRFGQAPSRRHDLFEEDLAWLRGQLASAGMSEVAAVDLSWPDLPCSVVRVVIPGLEGVCTIPGYRPGPRALARERASA
jgi:YcaO-like protein with predicted kinase domain